MALQTAIAKLHRLLAIGNTKRPQFTSPSFQISSTAATPNFHHQLFTSPETSSSTSVAGFFTKLYHRRQINQSPRLSFPGLFYLPVGEKLREKLNISDCERVRPPTTENAPSASDSGGLSVRDVRKIVRCSQLQNVRSALKLIPTNSITYAEFVNICSDACDNRDQGVEFAKLLDVAGDVLVLGNVVFLYPDQVAKSMEKVISQSIAIPNDPRKQELEELEQQKALIDRKALSKVRCELYCGLGLLTIQTLGFMRLTFWELSWDVMEPICFFVTSFHFALAYMFFLRTSKEPSFEGYFQRRFRVKQAKLMSVHGFDYERYNELCSIFYPARYALSSLGKIKKGFWLNSEHLGQT
ncbi:hypothetical protein L1987_53321 [Smallanthus sonchifolius]|uniref:Uncharacterized protein n=1 Tax=Smallanthus sonchifolius TaxID=185202 RepID=A0ACB9EV23_9ASTR|nr:hypothetical protein L1987_53321 [Smallanthus sonchifolius]